MTKIYYQSELMENQFVVSKDFISYTTEVLVTDDNNVPLPNQSCNIAIGDSTDSSNNSDDCENSIYINGQLYKAEMGKNFGVKTNAAGRITIVTPTDSLVSVNYKINTNEGDEHSVIPSRKTVDDLFQQLSSIHKGSDIDRVVKSNNLKKGPLATNYGNSEDVAKSLKSIRNMWYHIKPDGKKRSKYIATNASETSWGFIAAPDKKILNCYNGNKSYDEFLKKSGLNADEVDKLPESSMSEYRKLAGLKGIVHVFAKPAESLSNQWHVIVKVIGDKITEIRKFTINTIEDITSSVHHWIIHLLNITLQDITDWVGFLFNWEDVKGAQKFILNNTNRCLDLTKQYIKPTIKAKITNLFEGIKENLSGELPSLPSVIGVQWKTMAFG